MKPRFGQRMAIWSVVLVLVGGMAVHAAPPKTQPPASFRTGQRISLDLKGVDILDVLKLLSQKSGLNFIAGRNVSGRVTIFVNNVDVWDAFELIIGANDLAYERKGDIITVMMARDYELIYGQKFQERTESLVVALKHGKVVQVATVLNQIKSSVGRVVADEATNTLVLSDVPLRLTNMQNVLKQLDRPTESRIYSLNYSEAEKLKEKVQEQLSPIGTFVFDARSNKVIITDLKEVLVKTDRIIHAFDVPDNEVLIEAKIVKVHLSDTMQFGIDWQRVQSGIDTTIRNRLPSGIGDVFAATNPATGIALKIVGRTNTDSKIIIDALQTLGKTETLSNPRIMVGNNQEAKILVGTKQAYVTVTTTVPGTGPTVNAPQVQFVDVGVKLAVTPSIKRDGHVQLKIHPEVSSVSSTVTIADSNIPIVATTEAETNVLVKSGTTVILGGLIESTDSHSRNDVPWLGNLPVIGRAFRSTNNSKDKTETVLFLTPQIVMPDGSPYVVPSETAQAAEAAAVPDVVLKDPVPPGYRQQVRQRLQTHLMNQFLARSLGQGSVAVSFVLDREGKVVGEPIITSQQGEPFIEAAKAALAQAQPFAPFPVGVDANEVRFRLSVEHQS